MFLLHVNRNKILFSYISITCLMICLSGCASAPQKAPQVKLYIPPSLESENVETLMAIQYPAPPKFFIKDGIPTPTINDLDGGLYAIDGTPLPETGGIIYLSPGKHEVTFGRIVRTRKSAPNGAYHERSGIGRGTANISGEAGKIYSWGQFYNSISLSEKGPVLKEVN